MKRSFAVAAACVALALCGSAADARRIAVLAQNKSGVADVDEVLGDIRERVTAAFSDVDGFKVVAAPAAALDGSAKAVAAPGCDFVAVATVLQAETSQSDGGGILNNEYSLRMEFKVMDSAGARVDGIPEWSGKYQMIGAGLSPADCYRSLVEDWGAEVSVLAVTKAETWPAKAKEAPAAKAK